MGNKVPVGEKGKRYPPGGGGEIDPKNPFGFTILWGAPYGFSQGVDRNCPLAINGALARVVCGCPGAKV